MEGRGSHTRGLRRVPKPPTRIRAAIAPKLLVALTTNGMQTSMTQLLREKIAYPSFCVFGDVEK